MRGDKFMAAEKFGYIYSEIKNYGIIPVIKIKEVEKALSAAQALFSGGLNIAEIAFNTKHAAETIKKISGALPEMLIAAGSVETKEQAKSAIDSGAEIIMSLGLDENIVSYCVNSDIAVIPEYPVATITAGDIEKALNIGIDIIKFSVPDTDTDSWAGVEIIKTLSAQFPKIRFIPCGGITEDNILDYLLQEPVIACGGSFMLKEEYIKIGNFEKIKDLAVQAIKKMLGFDLAHVVINCENAEQADRDASKIESIFGLEKADAGTSIANADIIHFMKSKSYGKNGQIAISTNFLDRAVFYLKEAKKQFIDESARFDNDEKLTSIYLDNIIGGFAIKLVRK